MNTQQYTRRSAIFQGALAGAAAMVPVAALANTAPRVTDPIIGWHKEWRIARDEYEAAPIDDEALDEVLYRKQRALADEIIDAKAVTQEGIAAQLEVLMEDAMVDDCTGGLVPQMMGKIIGSLRAGLSSGAIAGV